MTAEEKRAYQRGYQAGRKRVAAEQAEWLKVQEQVDGARTRRSDAFFNAALEALITREQLWSMDGKPVNNLDLYVELASRFAAKAMEKRKYL